MCQRKSYPKAFKAQVVQDCEQHDVSVAAIAPSAVAKILSHATVLPTLDFLALTCCINWSPVVVSVHRHSRLRA